MLKINISPLHNSESINVGKTTYNIEFNVPAWVFRKVESKVIIKRNTDKNKLKDFAVEYCSTHNAELNIKDNSGNTEEIIHF